jgi:cytochrome P450
MMGSGHAASDRDLHDQVLTLIMAGHETTAKSLTWTLYLLDRNPDVAEALYAEVDRVLDGRVPTAADHPALALCTAAVKEAMRLYPPIWLISRRAVADDVLDGYHVPAGSLVCLSQWVLHRDPRHWADPLRFDPHRFLGGALTPHAYLPFGGGDRICIGQHFALIEATLTLAMVLQRFRMRLAPDAVVEPEALVTLRPRYGMPMLAVPR